MALKESPSLSSRTAPVDSASKPKPTLIHSLADHRRELSLERLGGQTITAAPGFQLVVSYNPGYQNILKDMKPSTRQRMIAIELEYPDAEHEALIVRRESGQSDATVDDLLRFARAVRKISHPGMREVCSTRTLVAAARLMRAGLSFRDAAVAAIAGPLSDDQELRRGLVAMIDSYAD